MIERATLMLACLVVLCAPVASRAQSSSEKPSGVRVVWRDRPSIRFGDVARVDLRLRLQYDLLASDLSDVIALPDAYWARKRFGFDGGITNWLSFQVDRDFTGPNPWRDVYVTIERVPRVLVRVGRFKLPFGLDENTSVVALDFVHRSRAADLLSPGRDQGLMVHGHALRDVFTYEVGGFRHDGENGRGLDSPRVYGGPAAAAHLSAQPFRQTDGLWRSLLVGAAFVHSDVDEGFPALQGETAFGAEFFEPDVWVFGARRRYGVEFRWTPGPCSVKSEYIRLTQERRGESVENTDLPLLVAAGWYVSGTWTVTGERSVAARNNPARPIFRGGVGAVELTGRIEGLEFSSEAGGEAPSSSPRANVIEGNRLRVVTAGVNWYPLRYVRLQFNLIHEALAETPADAAMWPSGFWSRVLRLQFAF